MKAEGSDGGEGWCWGKGRREGKGEKGELWKYRGDTKKKEGDAGGECEREEKEIFRISKRTPRSLARGVVGGEDRLEKFMGKCKEEMWEMYRELRVGIKEDRESLKKEIREEMREQGKVLKEELEEIKERCSAQEEE